jgi:hypothetical protein
VAGPATCSEEVAAQAHVAVAIPKANVIQRWRTSDTSRFVASDSRTRPWPRRFSQSSRPLPRSRVCCGGGPPRLLKSMLLIAFYTVRHRRPSSATNASLCSGPPSMTKHSSRYAMRCLEARRGWAWRRRRASTRAPIGRGQDGGRRQRLHLRRTRCWAGPAWSHLSRAFWRALNEQKCNWLQWASLAGGAT